MTSGSSSSKSDLITVWKSRAIFRSIILSFVLLSRTRRLTHAYSPFHSFDHAFCFVFFYIHCSPFVPVLFLTLCHIEKSRKKAGLWEGFSKIRDDNEGWCWISYESASIKYHVSAHGKKSINNNLIARSPRHFIISRWNQANLYTYIILVNVR